MEALKENFIKGLTDFKLSTLDENPNSIYALTPDLRLAYFNKAWSDSVGLKRSRCKIHIGDSLLDAIQGPERSYYKELFERAMNSGEVLKHEYECNTPEKLRIYSQDIYPLNQGGVLIENSLRQEKNMKAAGREPKPFLQKAYLNETGFYAQCSNCRKTLNNGSQTWDWVPDLVQFMPDNVSHTICQVCFDHYWDLA